MSTARDHATLVLGDLAAHIVHGGTFDTWRAAALGAKGAGGESWAEQDPALPRIEASGIAAMARRWRTLRDAALRVVGLAQFGKAPVSFVFDPSMLAELLALGDEFTRDVTKLDGPLEKAMWQAWVRGLANAADELDLDAAIDESLASARAVLQSRGFELVRDGVARELRDKIVAELASGAYDGMNPEIVARQLRQQFAAAEYNWERLVRSEVAMAQSDAKLDTYRGAGVERVDYLTAGDSRVSTICRSLAAAGPYAIADAPVPVRDSHPNCRCTIVAHLDTE